MVETNRVYSMILKIERHPIQKGTSSQVKFFINETWLACDIFKNIPIDLEETDESKLLLS